MKRNETVLVYGVTGLLVVILLVAVVFGNDGSASQTPSSPSNAAKTADLGGLMKGSVVDDHGKLVKLDPDPKAPAAPGSEAALKVDSPPTSQPSKPPVLDPDAAFLLGTEREGNYRRVTVQGGESFSTLLERYGIDQSRREEVMRLNEQIANVSRLRAGDTLILPWVDDDKLIAAAKERKARVFAPDRTKLSGALAPAAAIAGTRDHKVKRGESLWKLAQETDAGNVTQAMERIKELNPSVSFDLLREGTVVKLPAK